MKKPDTRFAILFLVLALLVLGCNTSVLVPTAVPLPTATPTWTLLPPATATASATSTPEPTATSEGTKAPPTDTPFVCPGAPPPRVKVGDLARVTITNGLPLRVRETPVVNNTNVIAQIAEGTAFRITNGPECAPIPNTSDSFVFWEITIESTGLTGWVAEGDKSIYFIELQP